MKTENVLRWFSGKSREKVAALIPAFERSCIEGEWEPNTSRQFVAALNKANVLKKMAKEIQPELDSIRTRGYSRVSTALEYASWRWEDTDVQLELAADRAITKDQMDAVRRAREAVKDFLPIYRAAKRLDAVRPKPVYTAIGVSKTITKTLLDARLDLDPKTVRMPPTKGEWRDEVDEDGYTSRVWVEWIDWPENTRFGRSRFHRYARQCEACGHRISNPWNWAPFLIDDKTGIPHSLWVGRDCAESVFGVKIKGKMHFDEASLQIAPKK